MRKKRGTAFAVPLFLFFPCGKAAQDVQTGQHRRGEEQRRRGLGKAGVGLGIQDLVGQEKRPGVQGIGQRVGGQRGEQGAAEGDKAHGDEHPPLLSQQQPHRAQHRQHRQQNVENRVLPGVHPLGEDGVGALLVQTVQQPEAGGQHGDENGDSPAHREGGAVQPQEEGGLLLSPEDEKGGQGGVELAKVICDTVDNIPSSFKPLYDEKLPIKEKIDIIAREIYGASNVNYTSKANKKIKA